MQTHAFQLVVTYDLGSTGSFQHAVRGGPGACSPGKFETLRDIISSILGHTCIWVTSFSQTLMLGSVQKYLFSVCDRNSLSSWGLLASSDNLDTKYYMLLESFGW